MNRLQLEPCESAADDRGWNVRDDGCSKSASQNGPLAPVPDYILEFIWIMGKFQSCTKEVIQDLIRTPSMKRHLSTKTKRLTELLKAWEVSEGSL